MSTKTSYGFTEDEIAGILLRERTRIVREQQLAQSTRKEYRDAGLKPSVDNVGIFKVVPLPWRYDSETRNVVAFDGGIVCRNGDSVFGFPEVGEAIVKVFNDLAGRINTPCHECGQSKAECECTKLMLD